jgi:hypothetical protein
MGTFSGDEAIGSFKYELQRSNFRKKGNFTDDIETHVGSEST